MLEGLKIVAFNHFVMGPLGVQALADLGAEVIAVEPVTGGFHRHWSPGDVFVGEFSLCFACANRGKKSIAIDLRTPAGMEISRKLITAADVLVENYRPGVMDRLGLGVDEARRLNPEIIYVSATGYGTSGPYVERPGQDLLIQALTGIAETTSSIHDESPRGIGFSVVDHHGAAWLANGVLAALVQKARTGKGSRVEVSLFDAALHIQSEAITAYTNGKQRETRQVPNVTGWYQQAPYGFYACKDGAVAISVCSLANLGAALNNPELAQIPETDRYARSEEICRLTADACLGFTQADLVPRLSSHDVWCAPVQSYGELADDAQVASNEMIMEYELSADLPPVKVVGHPVKFDGVRPRTELAPQALGAQSQAILLELGYPSERIAEFAAQGVIASPPGSSI